MNDLKSAPVETTSIPMDEAAPVIDTPMSRLRIERHLEGIHHNADHCGCQLAKQVLAGKLSSIENGIVR